MDIKTVCAVGGIVLGGVWAISRRFTRIEDRLDANTEVLKNLWCLRDHKDDCKEDKPEE